MEEIIENRINVTMPSMEPQFIEIKATIMALADVLLSDEQWKHFNDAKIKRMKSLFSELVKQNPHLLDESPELKDLLK